MQDSLNLKKTKIFLDCLRDNNVKFVDTYSILKKNLHKKIYIKTNYGHPTAFANEIVAKLVSNGIVK